MSFCVNREALGRETSEISETSEVWLGVLEAALTVA